MASSVVTVMAATLAVTVMATGTTAGFSLEVVCIPIITGIRTTAIPITTRDIIIGRAFTTNTRPIESTGRAFRITGHN